MSIEYCEKCDEHIDTDFDAEHFDEEVNGCEATFEGGLLGELKESVSDLKKPFAGYIDPEQREQVRQEKAEDHALDERI